MTNTILRSRKLFSILILMFSLTLFGQDFKDLRYFMQGNLVASAIPYGNNPAAGNYVKSDDAKIYYEVYGKGSTVVVLHGGIVGSPLEMGRFIDSLSQKHQVIAVSTRGHGKSEMGKQVPTYNLKAKDVNAVVEAVTKEKVTVVGFSDGGYTGFYFAKNYPEKIKSLVAIGAGEWKKGFREFKMNSGDYFAMDDLYWKQQMKLRPEPKKFDVWIGSINTFYNQLEVGKDVFSEIKCPVLVLAGEKDANAPLDTVIAAYKMIPNAQLSIIPNAPHPAFLVNFNAVWAAMTPFLAQNN